MFKYMLLSSLCDSVILHRLNLEAWMAVYRYGHLSLWPPVYLISSVVMSNRKKKVKKRVQHYIECWVNIKTIWVFLSLEIAK